MRTRYSALVCLFLLLAACQSKAPSQSLLVEFHPYDFHQATPEKLQALLELMEEESREGDRARYIVSQVRLDWFLTAWLTRDRTLLGSLGSSLGISRCSQREEWARCLQEIPQKIYEGLGEVSFVAEAPALRSLLAALKAEPGSAVLIAGIHSASRREGEIGLRARIAQLAAFRERLALLEEGGNPRHEIAKAFSSREDALEALALAAPFTCTEGFLSVTPKDPSRAVEQIAGLCGYACPAHNKGRLRPDDTPETLLADCPLSYYGLSSGQERFLTERNFVALKILNDLAQSLEQLKAAPHDPLAALLAPTIKTLSADLEKLRLPAALSLRALSAPSLESAAFYPVDKEPYLTISATRVGVALWPTLRIQGKSASLQEGEYLHPGKVVPEPSDPASLKKALEAAVAFERALPVRLPSRAHIPEAPPSLPTSPNPQGQRDPGKPLFVLADQDITAERLFSVSHAASEAGYGRLFLISGHQKGLSGAQAPALEVWPVRGEDLAYPALAPWGFPGGALIVLIQKEGVRALLPPGLERSSLPDLARVGIKRDASGKLSPIELSDFLRTFLPQKLILAAAPSTPLPELALLLDEIKRRAPEAQIVFSLAPEEGRPSWVWSLPRATHGAFFSLAPSSDFEFIVEPEPLQP